MNITSYIVGACAGVSALGFYVYKNSKQKPTNEPLYENCHGTTYSALYLMSRLKGDNKNYFVPFGELDIHKIPVFSGECFRGIASNGINRTYTSWVNINYNWCARSYAKNNSFHFSFEKTKQFLVDIIKRNDENSPPYANSYSSPYWHQILLKLRQVRAWDESIFQKELKIDLAKWIQSEISYLKAHATQPISEASWGWQDMVNERYKTEEEALRLMYKIQKEIEATPNFQLSEENKSEIVKTYPIVFLTPHLDVYRSVPLNSCLPEFGIGARLKLGSEIQGIATDPEHIDDIKRFLKSQDLENKVRVISFGALALEPLTHQIN